MKKTYEFEIIQDSDSNSPREWDNVTTMFCFHKRYNLGDKNPYTSNEFNSWEEFEQQIKRDYKRYIIKPLYLYDHSGITISTSPFGCQFDSGQVGFIFIEEKKWKMCMGETEVTEERMLEIIENEVKTYDQYLTGDVYGYRIYEVETCDKGHEHKTEINSCWGYYGEESCEEDAQSLINHYQTKLEVC